MTRVAVIGAGWYAAASHIPTLASIPGVVLDGVCRLGAAELERVRREFGFAFASEDVAAVLARRPEAVIVASPHPLHHAHAAAALEAGAHVLVEKPMTLDPAGAWDLVARAERLGRHLLVANGYHWRPGLAEIRALLQGGAVGRIEHAACSFVSATRPVFAGAVGLRRWGEAFFRPDRGTWQDPAAGGGFAWGQMSHAVALLLWLTGLEPKAVAGAMLGEPVDLACAATLRCAGGAVATLSGAAAWPEGQRALLRLLVTGEAGSLELSLDQDRAALHRLDGAPRDLSPPAGAWSYDCEGPVRALVALARGKTVENLAPGTLGAGTVGVLSAWHASAHAGRVAVPVAGPPTR
ncbi:Gfo/Idh/MocA family oxidoreductase [Roseomonas sp. OT10]|uniref:Gfo/Idh/MocA family protein n=1 Tax=Roseomonas cutis TaxID=2897332 RepID=UPI001E38B789|nr:Gfo/Idh/MocA family oxidoreductase [Roseomonas sp. OT10]UFN48829.1 Gfo/Idh/MocA family oxidoreductase [Roseomonas sp. OT10]